MQRFRPHQRRHDLTEQQWRIMRALAELGSAEMLDLARLCCIHAPSLSRTVPKLEERGIVARSRLHAGDQRRVTVSLTPTGRALFAMMAAESEAIYAELAAELGRDGLREITGTLERLIGTLGPGDSAPEAE